VGGGGHLPNIEWLVEVQWGSGFVTFHGEANFY
jgi:hypothetical protein